MVHTTRTELLEQVKRYLAKAISERGGPGSKEFAAWEEFFDLYTEIVTRFAASLGVPSDESDDLLEEVWGDVIRLLPKFEYDRTKGGFRRWLSRIVRSKVIDAVRRRKAQPAGAATSPQASSVWENLADPDAQDPADVLEQKFRAELVRWAVEKFREEATAEQFEVFQHCQLKGVSPHDAAKQLGLTDEAARASLYRARKRLRQIMQRAIGREEP